MNIKFFKFNLKMKFIKLNIFTYINGRIGKFLKNKYFKNFYIYQMI